MPTLLLLRNLRDDLPSFLRGHFTERVACLAQTFKVVVRVGGGDLGRLCDLYQPDLIMLELGADSTWPGITNTAAHPDIPRIGFANADAFDVARAAFVSASERLGVSTYFTHAVSMGEYSPEFADRLFFWPNFVDPDIFHVYDVPKTIDIQFSGSRVALYPWRNRTRTLLQEKYDFSAMSHFGWSGSQANKMLVGADYARALAASKFVPACGSISKEVVRKHLEVPAVGACLIAEPAESLRAFGFEDMVNCILGDGPELFDKIDHLLADPAAYERVRRAGVELVAQRHTIAHRTQVHQWFELTSAGRATADIDQDGPAGAIVARQPTGTLRARIVVGNGVDRRLLASGWERFEAGDIASAAANFERCLEFTFMAEAVIGLVFCQLASGRVAAADSVLQDLWDLMSRQYGDLAPDPVVIATRIRLLLCQSNLAAAQELARRHAGIGHPELDRMRGVVLGSSELAPEERPPMVPSICAPPPTSGSQWRTTLGSALEACGQRQFAQQVLEEAPLAATAGTRLRRMSGVLTRTAGRTVRIARDRVDGAARRLVRPLKSRWMDSDWGRALVESIHRHPPDAVAITGARSGSVAQLVLRWTLRSTEASIVVWQPDGRAASAFPTNVDLLYVGPRRRNLLRSRELVESGVSVVIVEAGHRARIDAPSGFNLAYQGRGSIRIFVR